MSRLVPTLAPLVAASALALLGGCSPSTNPVTANRELGEGDALATRQLTPPEEQTAIQVMRDAVAGEAIELPTPARYGVRWRDVPDAVYWGGSACEMAIVGTDEIEGGLRFRMTTLADEPVELIVERLDPPEMVSMRATVGSVGQRTEDAARLVAEVRKSLEAFGRKPGFE